MASASLGTYSIKITGDATAFEKELAKVSTGSKQMVATIQQTSASVSVLSGSMKNSTFAIQQLAFGLQDAASVFSTGGVAGAVRAASNNVIQFASLINPLAGTVAAFALTGIGLAVDNFSRLAKETKKSTDELEKFESIASKIQQDIKERREIANIQDSNAPDVKGKQAAFDDMAAEAARVAQAIEQQQAIIGRIQERALARSPGAGPLFGGSRERGAEVAGAFMTESEREAVARATREIEAGTDITKKVNADRDRAEQELKAAKARELELINQKNEQEQAEFQEALNRAQMKAAIAAQEELQADQKKNAEKERDRQNLITGSLRDQQSEIDARRRINPLSGTGAATIGSSALYEAVTRNRLGRDSGTDAMQRALNEQVTLLRGIEANTAQTTEPPAVIEEF